MKLSVGCRVIAHKLYFVNFHIFTAELYCMTSPSGQPYLVYIQTRKGLYGGAGTPAPVVACHRRHYHHHHHCHAHYLHSVGTKHVSIILHLIKVKAIISTEDGCVLNVKLFLTHTVHRHSGIIINYSIDGCDS